MHRGNHITLTEALLWTQIPLVASRKTKTSKFDKETALRKSRPPH